MAPPRTAHAPYGFKVLAFGLGLVTISLLWSLFDPGAQTLLDYNTNATTAGTAARASVNNYQAIWANAPTVLVMLGVLMMIAGAAFESRGGA